jgi:hypothetical protein
MQQQQCISYTREDVVKNNQSSDRMIPKQSLSDIRVIYTCQQKASDVKFLTKSSYSRKRHSEISVFDVNIDSSYTLLSSHESKLLTIQMTSIAMGK